MKIRQATMNEAKAIFSANLFLSVAHFRGIKDVRYYLNGVHVYPAPRKGAFIADTDGHTLAAVYDEHATCAEAVTIVTSPELVRAAAKLKPRSRKGGGVLVVGDVVTLHQGRPADYLPSPEFIQPAPSVLDGRYPDISRYMQPGDYPVPGLPGGVNPEYVDRLAASSKALGRKIPSARFFTARGADDAPIMADIGDRRFMAVIMPLRVDAERMAGAAWPVARPDDTAAPEAAEATPTASAPEAEAPPAAPAGRLPVVLSESEEFATEARIAADHARLHGKPSPDHPAAPAETLPDQAGQARPTAFAVAGSATLH